QGSHLLHEPAEVDKGWSWLSFRNLLFLRVWLKTAPSLEAADEKFVGRYLLFVVSGTSRAQADSNSSKMNGRGVGWPNAPEVRRHARLRTSPASVSRDAVVRSDTPRDRRAPAGLPGLQFKQQRPAREQR